MIQFIETNNTGPFFLYLPHTMLHNPLGVSEEFSGSSDWGEYGDAIQEFDHNVGRIFDTLKRLRIDDIAWTDNVPVDRFNALVPLVAGMTP